MDPSLPTVLNSEQRHQLSVALITIDPSLVEPFQDAHSAIHETQSEKLLHLRHKLQRMVIKSKVQDMGKINEVFTEVENFPITIPLLKEIKIGKLMKKVTELKIEPDQYNIKDRSNELIRKWKFLLDTPTQEGTGEDASPKMVAQGEGESPQHVAVKHEDINQPLPDEQEVDVKNEEQDRVENNGIKTERIPAAMELEKTEDLPIANEDDKHVTEEVVTNGSSPAANNQGVSIQEKEVVHNKSPELMTNAVLSNVASNQEIQESNTTLIKTIKNYLAGKDYKFYAAASATVILAGIGLYFFWTPKSPKPKTHKPSNRPKKKTKRPESAESARDRGTRNREEDAEAEEFEKYSTEQITALPREKRVTASKLLKDRGNVEFGKKNYQKAIKLYTQAIAFNQDDPIFYSNRAACFYNTNDYLRVIDDCNSALEMDPCYVKALNRRAMAYEQTARYEESLHDFTAACIIGEFKNENATTSIDRLLKKVASIKAKEIIKNRKKHLPSTKFISSYLDTFRKEPIDQDTEANNGLENTNSIEFSDQDLESNADDLFDAAERFVRQQRYEEAMNAYEKAINLGCTKMAKALNLRGTFTNLMGDSRSALADFQKALDLKPDYVQLYVKRATIYTEQGNIDEALKEFDKAINIDPSDPDIYYHRGQIHFLHNDFNMAVKDYQRRIELDPDFVFAYIQLAIAQYKSGSVEDGMKTFQQGLQKFPRSAEMHNYYGELLAEQRRIDEAIEQFDEANELQTGNFALPLVNKAMLCFHVKGDSALAEDYCRQALEIEPESDIANTIMSEILLARGNLEDALQCLEKYQEVARTEAELQGLLEYAE
ncbi:10722_t:CDS:10, partial [Scutellospora calospora]